MKFEVKPGSWVYVPTKQVAEYGRRIHDELLTRYRCPRYYFHLQSGGHLAALQHHIDDHFFAHLDIKNFFGSISRTRITRSLKDILSYPIARDIAKKSTVPVSNGQSYSHCLPYGFVQSPLLASICLHRSHLGTVIERLHQTGYVRISLYMDDLIVSGMNESITKTAFELIKKAASKSHFELNATKEAKQQPQIECFNISLSHRLLEITPRRLIEFSERYHANDNQFAREGIIGYIKSVNPTQLAVFNQLTSI
ncbi:reverse transcriptase domain-containing protein [Aeromonas dhakensis]|uniref:reverse transcriptase domain-containing protein n=1 Tax=Aeromonas dhakensis TaxID=196024 RepID=UPI00259FC665|nr:reverse transcriptase domain-containing protein [Aeromonas dhakensis]MDM5054435.1 reverse transcriptase domain-containing protein [Aeromonas dhakensis]MDM5080698.1 reverse transcriptase domain-containing protein [Aeromonas dhakensis]